MVVGTSLEETLQQASVKFGEDVVELRSAKGGVIDDITILRQVKKITCIGLQQLDCYD